MSELATPNEIPNRIQEPLPLVEVDRDLEYEIAEVVDSKIDCRRRACQLLYLVQWAGYEGTDKELTWILATELDHASEVVAEFHSRYLDKPGPL
jgi:hypothetical protein